MILYDGTAMVERNLADQVTVMNETMTASPSPSIRPAACR